MVAVELAVVRGEPVDVVDARQVVDGVGRRARPARRPRSAASVNLESFSAITVSFSAISVVYLSLVSVSSFGLARE